jgi:hypothetical protein
MEKVNLLDIPEKGEDPVTVSRKFKDDLISFFGPMNLETCVEISSAYGNTTYLLSHIFNQVVYVEAPSFVNNPNHFTNITTLAREKLTDRHNIIYIALDSYQQPWPFRYVDVFFIDCAHCYKEVCQDIDNALKYVKPGGYIIFDDWNLPLDDFGVRRAIQDKKLNIIKYIGDKIDFNPTNVFDFKFGIGEPEGVIVKI